MWSGLFLPSQCYLWNLLEAPLVMSSGMQHIVRKIMWKSCNFYCGCGFLWAGNKRWVNHFWKGGRCSWKSSPIAESPRARAVSHKALRKAMTCTHSLLPNQHLEVLMEGAPSLGNTSTVQEAGCWLCTGGCVVHFEAREAPRIGRN